MGIGDKYAIEPPAKRWAVPQSYEALFNWDMTPERESMLTLYQKGKERQWNAATRIDWSQDLDPDNPQQLPHEALPIHGAPFLEKMSAKERGEVFRHYQAWSVSQFLHGEQGALVCAAKVVTQVPDADARLYAATQVVDEARHVEAYTRLLEKFGVAYPITPSLQTLLDQVLRDSRWDMTYLGMQVVIEGLALASFALIRDQAKNPLASAVNAYVMEDEARHVAFGRLALRDYYPQLTQAERDEREEFLVEACYLMRDRFEPVEVWKTLGLPVAECVAHAEQSETRALYRAALFSRIVPVVRNIGLWGSRVRSAYAKMGIMGFAQINVDALHAHDEDVARQFDARRDHVARTIEDGKG
jgi:hypothetical protein